MGTTPVATDPAVTVAPIGGWATSSFSLCIIMPVFAGLAATGRIYGRQSRNVGMGIDDWLIITALPLYWIQAIITAIGVCNGGVGYHIEALSQDRINYMRKLMLSVQFFYCSSLALTKASICFFLLRIFTVKRWFRYAAYATIALSACFMLVDVFATLLICRPIQANWNSKIPGARCGSEHDKFSAVAVFDVAVDLIIITLPIPVVWSLKMSVRDKFSLMALFVFGVSDTVVGVLRIVASIKIDFNNDWTFELSELWFWSILEPGLAICVVCLVVMRPVMDRMIPRRKAKQGDPKHSASSSKSERASQERGLLSPSSGITQTAKDPFDLDLWIPQRCYSKPVPVIVPTRNDVDHDVIESLLPFAYLFR